MNCGNTYYFIDDCNDICKCKNGVQKEFSEKLELLDLIDDINEIIDENEQLKKELSDIDGQLLMLDNCDNWDYDRMKHTVREIAEIIGYNGTINPKRR